MKNTSIQAALLMLVCASAALAEPSTSNSTASKAGAQEKNAGKTSTAKANIGSTTKTAAVKTAAAKTDAAKSNAGTASVKTATAKTDAAKANAGTAAVKAAAAKTTTAPAIKGTSIKVPVKGPSSKAPATVAADGTPIWLDVKSAKLAAKLKNKPILADFYTDWCHWCKVMDRTTYHDSEVLKYLAANYVCMKADAQDGGDGQELATRFGISGFPTTLVILPSGKPLAVAEGYRDKPEFMRFMNAVAKLPKGK